MKTTMLILFLTGALLISLSLNYLFYTKAFIPLQAIRLDPMERSVYPEKKMLDDLAGNITKKPTLLFYGDSRALSWSNPILNQYYFINRAIGGQTSRQIAARFQQHVVPYKPNTLILQLCVNDLKMIPLFPEKRAAILHDCKQNIQQVIQQAHEINANVILSTVFPLGDISIARKLLGMKEPVIIEAIDDVNIFIRSLANDKTLIFDAYQLLKGTNGRKINPQYSRDWLHLNHQGYAVLNKEMIKVLNVMEE